MVGLRATGNRPRQNERPLVQNERPLHVEKSSLPAIVRSVDELRATLLTAKFPTA